MIPAPGLSRVPGAAGWFALGIAATFPLWSTWVAAWHLTLMSLGGAMPADAAVLGRAAAGHLAAAAGLAAMLAAAFAAGTPVVRVIRLRGDALDRAGWGWLLGAALASGLGLALGLAGLLRPTVLATVSLVGAALGAPGLLRLGWSPARGSRVPVALLAAVLAGYALLTRLPGTLQDPMAYTFAAAEEYLRAGRLHAELAHFQWTMPLGLEMLYLVPWWLGGITAAKLVNLALLVAGCVAIRGLARALGGRGAPAAILFGSAGVVANIVWQGKDDLAAAVFAAGAGWGVALGLGGSSAAWLAGGACAGAAVACRLTAGLAVVPLALAALAVAPRRSRVAGAVAAGLFVCGPWLVRSWLECGNPCTPFATRLFPDLGWSPALQESLRGFALGLSSSGPWRPSEVMAGVWRVLGDPEVGSAALVILVPLGWILSRGAAPGALRLAAVAAYACWLSTERNPRFLLPVVPWLAALASVVSTAGAGGASPLRPRLARVASSALGPMTATAALAALLAAGRIASPDGPAVWLGSAGRDEVWKRRFTTYETTRRWACRALPADARILLTGGDRRLGFGRRVFSTALIFTPPFWALTRDASTPGEVRKRLRQRGITHWLNNFVEGEYRGLGWYQGPAWDDRQLALGVTLMRRYARPVRGPDTVDHEGGGYWAFELTRAPGDFPAMFLPGTEGRLKDAFGRYLTGDATGAFADARRLAGPAAELLEVQALLAFLALEAGEPETASRWLKAARRAGYVGDGTLIHEAMADLATGRTDEAVRAAARAALMHGPDHRLLGSVLSARARVRAARGDRSGAARDLAEAAWWRTGTRRGGKP
ncbi:MAG: hypothetical protein AAB152_01375 [Candidatus Coatesbacteria bacterium]